MDLTKITPVILSGGSGTRLWPLSRTALPKQMLRLLGTRSLIQQALLRAPTDLGFERPVVVAGASHRTLIEQQLAEIGVSAQSLILEPAPRNTAPAIALAAFELPEDALMLVMPSDHVIQNEKAFREAIKVAAPFAERDWLVTFGITPDSPATGYGYIEAADTLGSGVRAVAKFVEKPDAATARIYVSSGSYYWNAGIFLIRAGAYVEALRKYVPDMAVAVHSSLSAAARDDVVVLPNSEAFSASPSDSIDYAVMERSDRVAVVPVSMGWSDIGSFSALWEQSPRDAKGNAVFGDVIVHQSRDCLLHSDGPVVAAVGVSNITVVAGSDAVLVVAHDAAQDVKHVVDALRTAGSRAVDVPSCEHFAWGTRNQLALTRDVDVSMYRLRAGGTASVTGTVERHATLCSGKATIAGTKLQTGSPMALPTGRVEIAADRELGAEVLLTISLKCNVIG